MKTELHEPNQKEGWSHVTGLYAFLVQMLILRQKTSKQQEHTVRWKEIPTKYLYHKTEQTRKN